MFHSSNYPYNIKYIQLIVIIVIFKPSIITRIGIVGSGRVVFTIFSGMCKILYH